MTESHLEENNGDLIVETKIKSPNMAFVYVWKPFVEGRQFGKKFGSIDEMYSFIKKYINEKVKRIEIYFYTYSLFNSNLNMISISIHYSDTNEVFIKFKFDSSGIKTNKYVFEELKKKIVKDYSEKTNIVF